MQRRGESPTWNGVEGERSEGLHKRSAVHGGCSLPAGVERAEDWGHSLCAPGAVLLRRLGFLTGRGAHRLFSGTALRAGTGPLRRVAEDAHLRPQTGRNFLPVTES